MSVLKVGAKQSQTCNSNKWIHLTHGWHMGFSSKAYPTAAIGQRRAMLKAAWEPHAGSMRGYWSPLVMCTPLLTGAGEHSNIYPQTPCYGNQLFSWLFLSPRATTLQWHGVVSCQRPCSLEKLKHMHICFSPYPLFSLPSPSLRQHWSIQPACVLVICPWP